MCVSSRHFNNWSWWKQVKPEGRSPVGWLGLPVWLWLEWKRLFQCISDLMPVIWHPAVTSPSVCSHIRFLQKPVSFETTIIHLWWNFLLRTRNVFFVPPLRDRNLPVCMGRRHNNTNWKPFHCTCVFLYDRLLIQRLQWHEKNITCVIGTRYDGTTNLNWNQ